METVETRLAALELAVDELRNQLERERTRVQTMRMTHTCPSCRGKRILQFRRVPDAGDAGTVPLSLNTKHSVWRGIQEGDPLEVYVCRECGLVEWHAPNIGAVAPDGDTIIELTHREETKRDRDPYR